MRPGTFVLLERHTFGACGSPVGDSVSIWFVDNISGICVTVLENPCGHNLLRVLNLPLIPLPSPPIPPSDGC